MSAKTGYPGFELAVAARSRKISRDDAIMLLREEQSLRKIQHNELVARIEQVAQLTADCRGYRERLEAVKIELDMAQREAGFARLAYDQLVQRQAQELERAQAPLAAERDGLRAVRAELRDHLLLVLVASDLYARSDAVMVRRASDARAFLRNLEARANI